MVGAASTYFNSFNEETCKNEIDLKKVVTDIRNITNIFEHIKNILINTVS